jgi:hypothetical protein
MVQLSVSVPSVTPDGESPPSADASVCPHRPCACTDPYLPRLVCVAAAVGQLLASQHEGRRAA